MKKSVFHGAIAKNYRKKRFLYVLFEDVLFRPSRMSSHGLIAAV